MYCDLDECIFKGDSLLSRCVYMCNGEFRICAHYREGEPISNECRYCVADWCHHPKRQPQEKCAFYMEWNKCGDFEDEEEGGNDDDEK